MKKTFTFLFALICIIANTNAQVWKLYTTANGLPTNGIKSLTTDLLGNIWAGTLSGVSKFDGTTFTNYTTTQGLSHNYIKSLTCDASGNVWLGTQNGLNKNTGSTFIQYHTTDGLPGNNIVALTNSSSGIWVGTSTGLSKYNGTNFTNYFTSDGLISNSIVCLSSDLLGNIWIGTSTGLSFYNGTTFTNYTTSNGLPSNSIKSLFCDNIGNMWIGTMGGLVKYNGSFTTYTTADGLLANSVTAIGKDNSNNIWIGYGIVGATRYNGTTFTNFNIENGLNYGNFSAILFSGNLVYFGCGYGLMETRKWTIPQQIYMNLDTNNISAGINSNGILFEKPTGTSSSFEVPKGSGKNSIFASSIWLGGYDPSNNLHLAAMRFQNSYTDLWSEPIFVNPNSYTDDSTWNRVWKISKAEIDYHILHYADIGYVVPASISEWPSPRAPYINVNNNSIYDPQNGDYPLIRGDQAIYSIYNDIAHVHGSGGAPLGIEVHALAYSYNSTDSALANTVFVNYTVINYSSNTYHDFYLGVYSDIDIGDAIDDFIGSDSTLSMYYGYNGDNLDTQYGTDIPAQGVLFLSSPMHSFTYFNNTASQFGDPVYSNEYYNVMNGYWKDGTPYTYGGNGYGGTTYTNYVYNGDPLNSSQWSEVSVGNIPADRRGVGSVGPFILPAGKNICIDLAFPNAIDYSGSNLTSVTLLKQRAADLITFYNSQTFNCGEILLDTTSLPRIYLGSNDTTVCKGAVIQMNNIVVGGVPPYHYQWAPSVGLNNDTLLNPTFTANQNIVYYVTVTDGNNNIVTDSINLSFYTATINTGNDTTYCNNQTPILTATSGFVSYWWSNGNNTQTTPINLTHDLLGVNMFFIRVWDNHGCELRDTILITFLPAPDINFGVDTFMCNTENFTLDVGVGFDNYLWSTGSTLNSITINGSTTPLGPTTYWVYVSNNNGCFSSDTIQITNNVCIGINNVPENGYKVFPNPINKGQLLKIQMPEVSNYTLNLTDVYGKTLYKKKINNSNKFDFETETLSKGVYFLKIISDKDNLVYQIVVN